MKQGHQVIFPGTRVESSPGQFKRFAIVTFIVFFSTFLLVSCAQIRKLTYPRDFIYLERQEINSAMYSLHLNIRQMNRILSKVQPVSEDEQREIISILKEIDDITDTLGAGQSQTNHLLIDDRIDAFKTEVLIATRAAQSQPPNYFPAGQLAGNCVACHRYR